MSKELEVLINLKENHLQLTKEKYDGVKILPDILKKREVKYSIIELAIKRNVPKEPLLDNERYRCGECNNYVSVFSNYCDSCGQAQEWRIKCLKRANV